MQNSPPLFDRKAVLRNQDRRHDLMLHNIARDELIDRLSLVNRSFTSPVIIGSVDLERPNAKQIADDDHLDLMPQAHDLAVHFMTLHSANDPVGQLIQCQRALHPDGLFLAVCLGGQTLNELRSSLAQAETEISKGLSPRVAPMAEIRDLGSALQRAGLSMPVADSLPLRFSYDSAFHLMQDLRGFGLTNALSARRKNFSRRDVFERCAEIYKANFSEGDKIIATFELIFLTGWSPDPSQPQPLRPGTATHSLAEALSGKQ